MMCVCVEVFYFVSEQCEMFAMNDVCVWRCFILFVNNVKCSPLMMCVCGGVLFC